MTDHPVGIAWRWIVLILALSACGTSTTAPVPDNERELVIGISFDQPGLGLLADGEFTGFEVDIARYIADELGIKPNNVEFREAPPTVREDILLKRRVDLVVAAYSITEERKQRVDFAGPYFATGQSIMVRSGDTDISGPESLTGGRTVCTVRGSTSAQALKERFADQIDLREYDFASLCVAALESGAVDAFSTDDIILAGYATTRPADVKMVGPPFTTEWYGIGVPKGESRLREEINDVIESMIVNGSWRTLLERNLSGANLYIPIPPYISHN